MEIVPASVEDAAQILNLQRLAYQSEAELYQDYGIAPLTQTLEELKEEFNNSVFLKLIDGKNIIGSVRARSDDDTCFIGRLIVHPKWQRKGIGTKLMQAIETYFANVQRYELFTGIKSEGNIRLYQRLGYRPFQEIAINQSVSLVYLEKHAVS